MADTCANHPERDAVGVCVQCRKYVCLECTTRIEGVNYCADCLPRVHRKESKVSRSWEKPAAALITALSLMVCSLLVGTCAVLIPKAKSAVSEAGREELNCEWMETVTDALRKFREDCGRFPDEPEGLEALVEGRGIRGWHGPYLRSRLADEFRGVRDTYETPLKYRSSGLQAPVILSAGANRHFQTDIDSLSYGGEGSGDDRAIWVE